MEKQYPFPFLDAYQSKDRDFFFGRDEEVETLYQLTQQGSISLLYGSSGTGKTSLIRCGLSQKFQSYDWLELYVRRGKNLVASTDRLLCEASGGAFVYSDQSQTLVEKLPEKVEAVYLASFRPLYLIFDQFEELFILGDKKEEKAFTSLLQELLGLNHPVKIIISIREEYLGYLFDMERKIPELLRKKLRVEPMVLEKVVRVLAGVDRIPNSLVHLKEGESEDIAREIFAIIKGEENRRDIDLPYLQVFFDRFYTHITGSENKVASCTFSLEALRQLPRFEDVLRDFLDVQVLQTASQLRRSPDEVWFVLSAFVSLDGTKDPLTLQELENRRPELDKQFLKDGMFALVTRRILRFDEKEHRYEIAHDSLAKQIHAKRSDEEIALLEIQRLIKSQVALKKEARQYFSEKQLQLIESYLSRFRPSDEERDWIERSRAHHEAERIAAIEKAQKELESARENAKKQEQLKDAALEAQKRAETNAKQARQRTRLAWGIAILAMLLLIVASVLAFNIQQQKAEIEVKRKEAQQALEQFEQEQAAKNLLQFNSLRTRSIVILDAGGCPNDIFEQMRYYAAAHPDSINLKLQLESLKLKNPGKCQ